MEGLLCPWALSLQEYDFSIIYQKDTQNPNAVALSRLDTKVLNSHLTAITILQPSPFLA